MVSWKSRWHGLAILALIMMMQTESAAQGSLPPGAQALLERARQANPTRYQFALDRGARIAATTDGRSFVLSWFPAATGAN